MSIESKGVLEPILVRPLPDGRFRIIAGERRFRAALEAGLAEIPCIELDVPDNEVLEIALIENLHRRDLHPFEEARVSPALVRHARVHPAADRRRRVGKSRVSITEAMSLLDIPEDLRDECRRADIDAKSVLLEIARLGIADKMEEAIALVAGGSTRDDLRAAEEERRTRATAKRRSSTSSTAEGRPVQARLSFAKSRVNQRELIERSEGVLKQLESGEIELPQVGVTKAARIPSSRSACGQLRRPGLHAAHRRAARAGRVRGRRIGFGFRPDLTQQDGFLHAAVVAGIADSACGYAAYTLMPADSRVLSVEFKLNLLRPAKGERFRAEARVLRSGRTISVVRADVLAFGDAGEDGKVVATMLGTMIRQ